MFNLIFKQLRVRVLSQRCDTTAHPQDWQGGHVGMRCAFLTASWSQESQSWFGARQLSQCWGKAHAHNPLPRLRQFVSHCLGIHHMWLWSETSTALWKLSSWWLISVIYSGLSKTHPATAYSWIPSPRVSALVKSSGGKISWVKLLTCDCKAFSVIEKNTAWMNGLKWAGY